MSHVMHSDRLEKAISGSSEDNGLSKIGNETC